MAGGGEEECQNGVEGKMTGNFRDSYNVLFLHLGDSPIGVFSL